MIAPGNLPEEVTKSPIGQAGMTVEAIIKLVFGITILCGPCLLCMLFFML
jgi:hypothetical protein